MGGEARYTYQSDDLRVSSGAVKAKASAQSNAFHYDVLIHATSKESSVRPFFAVGAGMKFYRGTGAEPAFQPLSNLVVLTHTNEAQPLISVGGGVKFQCRAGRFCGWISATTPRLCRPISWPRRPAAG